MGVGMASAASPSPSAFLQGLPYLIDAPKEGKELAEQGSTHAGDMHKRALGVWGQVVSGEGAHLDLGVPRSSSSTGTDSFGPQAGVTSLPRGIPLPRAQVSPMTLATKVFRVRYSFSTTPRKMVFISGMPDPGGVMIPGESFDVLISEDPITALPFFLIVPTA